MATNYKLGQGQSSELIDKVLGELNDALMGRLGWLDHAYERAERTVKIVNGKRIYTPCFYRKDNDYVDLSPDSRVGNVVWYWIDDPQEIKMEPYLQIGIKTRFAQIFWWDFRTVYNFTNHNKEQIKADILHEMNTITLKSGTVSIDRACELAENIFRGFSLDEVDNQFLMHPYGGIRFEGWLTVHESCSIIQDNSTTTTTL